MNSHKLEKLALKLSVFGTLFLTILGISFGLWIQSEAIILDGFFNFISLIMALASLWVSWLVSQPASRYFQFDYLNFIPLVNLIKGLLIMITSLFALILSIITIFNGGRNLDSQMAVLYAIVAAITCLILAIIQRAIARKNSSTMIIVDARNWLVNGSISLALVIAFSSIIFLENSPYNWFVPYSDSAIVILVVLISIPIPIKIIIENVKQLLLAAPDSEIQAKLKEILTTIIKDLPCEQYSLRMTQTGQYIYVYLLWLFPKKDANRNIEDIDRYRSLISKTLQETGENLHIDIIFTVNQTWFQTKVKNLRV